MVRRDMQDLADHAASLAVDPITLEVIRHAAGVDHQPDRRQYQAHGVQRLHLRVQRFRRRPRRRRWAAHRAVHRRDAAVRRRRGRHGGARRPADLRRRAAPTRRRGALQSRRGAGPAPQQHGDVHADPCRAGARDADRILRHQRALDRYRRRGAAFARHLHGGTAAPLHQAVVEGRADRGGLPHHREQHAPADRAAGRYRGAARRLPARARPHDRAGRQIRRRDVRCARSI